MDQEGFDAERKVSPN